MPRTPDDDALSWAGEEADPTLARSPEPQRAVPRRRPDADPSAATGRTSALGATAARRAAASGSATAGSDEPHALAMDDDAVAAPDASPEVVGLAFFGAVAVLEAIAWFFVVRDNPSSAGSAFQVGVAQATEAPRCSRRRCGWPPWSPPCAACASAAACSRWPRAPSSSSPGPGW